MRILQTTRMLPLLTGIILVTAGASYAQITGTVWEGDFSDNANTVPTGPSAQFNTAGINYDSSNGYTIASFLNNPTFFNQTGGFNSAHTADNIHIEFKGQVPLNAGVNSFNVGHDDGLTLSITGIGLVVNAPSATYPVNTPFDVTAPSAGNYSFTLEYNECCGPPAELIWKINDVVIGGNVPDAASTWMLLGSAVTGLGLIARKVRRQA